MDQNRNNSELDKRLSHILKEFIKECIEIKKLFRDSNAVVRACNGDLEIICSGNCSLNKISVDITENKHIVPIIGKIRKQSINNIDVNHSENSEKQLQTDKKIELNCVQSTFENIELVNNSETKSDNTNHFIIENIEITNQSESKSHCVSQSCIEHVNQTETKTNRVESESNTGSVDHSIIKYTNQAKTKSVIKSIDSNNQSIARIDNLNQSLFEYILANQSENKIHNEYPLVIDDIVFDRKSKTDNTEHSVNENFILENKCDSKIDNIAQSLVENIALANQYDNITENVVQPVLENCKNDMITRSITNDLCKTLTNNKKSRILNVNKDTCLSTGQRNVSFKTLTITINGQFDIQNNNVVDKSTNQNILNKNINSNVDNFNPNIVSTPNIKRNSSKITSVTNNIVNEEVKSENKQESLYVMSSNTETALENKILNKTDDTPLAETTNKENINVQIPNDPKIVDNSNLINAKTIKNIDSVVILEPKDIVHSGTKETNMNPRPCQRNFEKVVQMNTNTNSVKNEIIFDKNIIKKDIFSSTDKIETYVPKNDDKNKCTINLKKINLKRNYETENLNINKKVKLDESVDDESTYDFTRIIFESNQTLDENNPNWQDVNELSTAEEYFNFVSKLWQADDLPNPHITLTKRFVTKKQKIKKSKNKFTKPTIPITTYFDKRISHFKSKMNEIQNKKINFHSKNSSEIFTEFHSQISKLRNESEDQDTLNKFYLNENSGLNAHYLTNRQYEDILEQDKIFERIKFTYS